MPTISYNTQTGMLSGSGFPVYANDDGSQTMISHVYYHSLQKLSPISGFWHEVAQIDYEASRQSALSPASFSNFAVTLESGTTYRVSIGDYITDSGSGSNTIYHDFMTYDTNNFSNTIIGGTQDINLSDSITSTISDTLNINILSQPIPVISVLDSITQSYSDISIQLIPKSTYSGYVKNNGIAVSGATVLLIEKDTNKVISTVTDNNGYFLFNVFNINQSLFTLHSSFEDINGNNYTSNSIVVI